MKQARLVKRLEFPRVFFGGNSTARTETVDAEP